MVRLIVTMIPFLLTMTAWVGSLWISFSQPFYLKDLGASSLVVAHGNIHLAIQVSGKGTSFPLPGYYKNGFSWYESAFTLDNGSPLQTMKPTLGKTIKGRADRFFATNFASLSIPLWIVTSISLLLPLSLIKNPFDL